MKKSLFVIMAAVAAVLMTGCQSYKQVPYFQDMESVDLSASRGLYDARIMPKDILTITVNSDDPDGMAERPFNLMVRSTLQPGGQVNTSYGGSMLTYLVDNDGTINFPVVGRIRVEGMTKTECEKYIESLIRSHFSDDTKLIVTVKMSNYRVTVTGEVNRPGVVSVASEKVSILEALAQAGDLSIYGRRDNVLLIREDNKGEKHSVRLDLTKADIINSPYYYLQQNDIIYVTPNQTKAKNSDIGQSTTLWFSATSILISLTSLLYNILN